MTRPRPFDNGLDGRALHNPAEQNQGSCRVFAFARLHDLDERRTLAWFGEHYRHVLATPGGGNHANIRAFMRHGRAGVRIHGEPLTPYHDGDTAQ